jgi:hypothetical protein
MHASPLRRDLPLQVLHEARGITDSDRRFTRRFGSEWFRFPLALLILAVWLTCGASSAGAVGLTLNWDNCIGAGQVTSKDFDCVGLGGPYILAMNLQTPGVTGVRGMDVVLDLQTSGADLSPFWHFETSGCNRLGLNITANRSEIFNTGCLATFTGTTGSSVTSVITSYSPGFGGANRAAHCLHLSKGVRDRSAARLELLRVSFPIQPRRCERCRRPL